MPDKDKFAQVAYISVTESGANTLTFSELNIASSLDKKHAMIVHKTQYQFAGSIGLLVGAADQINLGLSLSNSLTTTSMDQVEVFDRVTIAYDGGGVATTGRYPVENDFTNMPGGGLIVPVKKLYGWAQGVSIASAIVCQIRIYYTLKELKPEDYLEMVEAYNILT